MTLEEYVALNFGRLMLDVCKLSAQVDAMKQFAQVDAMKQQEKARGTADTVPEPAAAVAR